MKTIPICFIICIILLCSCSKSRRKHGQEQLKFSLYSEQATYVPDQNNPSLGLLTLYTYDDQIDYSSNLKKRGRKGKIPIENFLKGWDIEKNRFEQFPPKAQILFTDAPSIYQFILENPYYDKENKQLIFQVINPPISEPIDFKNVTFIVKGDHELTFSFRWRAPVVPFSYIRFYSYE